MLILTVSQINTYLASKMDEDKKLTGIMIRGEISNFISHSSGHLYFYLKDKECSLKAAMFKGNAMKLKFMPEDGMNVIALGNIKIYKRDGQLEIIITDLVPDGVGEVQIALDQLKKKLKSEGIFDESHKRPIPKFPSKIGVITSGTGAALQDVINILSRRYPIAELTVIPTLVQGENAPAYIANAFAKAENLDCDVIILARGGGSTEELSAFNTEIVAYAVYNSSVPVISAVGHETDFTIADMAADMRAPTPSAAAEIVSVSVDDIKTNIKYLEQKLNLCIKARYESKKSVLEKLNERLLRFSPKQKIEKDIQKHDNLLNILKSSYIRNISEKENKLNAAISKIDALSPVKVLDRGYSLVYKNGNVITKSSLLDIGDYIEIKMSDGIIRARIVPETEEN